MRIDVSLIATSGHGAFPYRFACPCGDVREASVNVLWESLPLEGVIDCIERASVVTAAKLVE